MKNIIILTIFLIVIGESKSFAQKKICGKIQYKHIMNLNRIQVYDHQMTFDNNQSFSKEIHIKSESDTIYNKDSNKGSTKTHVMGRKNMDAAFFYNDKTNFYFNAPLPNKTVLVKENAFNWKWKLHSERKKIGSFICQKATITFRGRNYIAWFTNKIPVSYGPWKFQGLSGLIIEVYDEEKTLHIITTKIRVGKSVDCSIKLDKNKLKNAITIKEYLKEREQFIAEMKSKISSKRPKGSPPIKWDNDCDDCSKGIEIFEKEN